MINSKLIVIIRCEDRSEERYFVNPSVFSNAVNIAVIFPSLRIPVQWTRLFRPCKNNRSTREKEWAEAEQCIRIPSTVIMFLLPQLVMRRR